MRKKGKILSTSVEEQLKKFVPKEFLFFFSLLSFSQVKAK